MTNREGKLFLHVMPKEKFTFGFVEFTFATFPGVDVRFIVYGDDNAQGYEPYSDNRVVPVSSAKAVFKDEAALGFLRDADVVILNWVNMSMLLSMWRYLPKTHLLFWGGDYSPYVEAGWNGVSHRLKRKLLQVCIGRSRGIIALLPGDLRIIETISNPDSSRHVCELGYLASRYDADICCTDKRAPFPVNILLGNSATPTNRHKSALDALSRFANEDIKIYAPLSYGDDAYRDEVISYGRELFGDKFVPVTEFMERSEYISFLTKISIGVFNYDRQQGLGNIHLLMRMGAKVFLSQDSGMLSEHIDNGAAVECLEDVPKLTFDEFCAPLAAEAVARNKGLYSGESNFARAKAHWGAFYGAEPIEGDFS